MSRDAWGADWGRHHRQKTQARPLAALRKKHLTAIYLLHRYSTEQSWFGRPVAFVKIGRTSRNPLVRSSELTRDGFVLLKYWVVPDDLVSTLERQCIKVLKDHFSNPYKGNEYFVVNTIEAALEALEPLFKEALMNSDLITSE